MKTKNIAPFIILFIFPILNSSEKYLKKLEDSAVNELITKLENMLDKASMHRYIKQFIVPDNIASSPEFSMLTQSTTNLYPINLDNIFDIGLENNNPDRQVLSKITSPDDKLEITCFKNNKAEIRNLETDEILHTVEHNDSVYWAAINTNNKYLITCSWDGTAIITDIGDLNDIKKLYTLTFTHRFQTLSISSDDKYIAFCTGNKAEIFDLIAGNPLLTIKHNGWVLSAKFSSDNQYIITGSADKTARITNFNTGEVLYTFNHNDPVFEARISQDNAFLLTIANKTTTVFNLTKSTTFFTLKHDRRLNAVTFGGNNDSNHYLVTTFAEEDGVLKITDLNAIAELKHLTFAQLRLICWLFNEVFNEDTCKNDNLPIILNTQQFNIYQSLPGSIKEKLKNHYFLSIHNNLYED